MKSRVEQQQNEIQQNFSNITNGGGDRDEQKDQDVENEDDEKKDVEKEDDKKEESVEAKE